MQPRRSLWQSLCQPDVYRVAIDRLIRNALRDPTGELALLRRDRDELAKRLAAEMTARTWRQRPVQRKRAILDKPRDIVDLPMLDRVVHSAVAVQLIERMEPILPDTLYSYRAGRGPATAILAIANALRLYKLRDIPLRERGLFAIRFDVSSYGDSIPVAPDSELWSLLREVIDEDPWFTELLHHMVRCDDPGRRVGVPVGSPLANPLTNIYLMDLDRELGKLGVMSARFGDDCMVLCDSEATATAARELIHSTLARKGLSLSEHKYLQAYWSAVGRPGPAGWPGTSHIAYVGVEIEFTGTTRLKAARRKDLLDAIDKRVTNLARFLDPPKPLTPEDATQRAAQLCAALKPAFDQRSPFALGELQLVFVVGSCRKQLAELDRQIAIRVASAAARRPGASAFRVVPWKSLYRLGLPSLVEMRNHA